MGTTDALADPAQVLLDGLAMTGQAGAGRARTSWQALGHVGRRGSGGASRAPRAPCRDDDPVRVRDGRIEQFDLETDDRMQADGLGRADETDGAVEAVVVRDGQAGQPESDGPLDQLVRCRRTIEEREVGVAMEFGVRGRCHGSLRSGSRLTGGSSL